LPRFEAWFSITGAEDWVKTGLSDLPIFDNDDNNLVLLRIGKVIGFLGLVVLKAAAVAVVVVVVARNRWWWSLGFNNNSDG
jgi:hypothetical protein